jgi:hypothetical protein
MNGFLEKISDSATSIEIVHSEPRVYTPEMVSNIREYFSGVPIGAIESRNQKADEISQAIRIAYSNNEVDRVPELQKELKRFRDQSPFLPLWAADPTDLTFSHIRKKFGGG